MIGSVKIMKAKKIAKVGGHHSTTTVLLDHIPYNVLKSITSEQLAELLDSMYQLTINTKAVAEKEILDEGAIWDPRANRLREIKG